MSVEKCSNDLLKEKANNARDTKECIIYMAESYEKINKKLEEISKNAMEEMKKQPIDKFHFDNSFDSQVQTIVIRKQEKNKQDKSNEDDLSK